MPAAAHTGAIAFGLVYIPVKLYTAVSESRISLNQLNRHTMNRVGYKKYDKGTGEEIASEDIIRGYEYTKGQYITLSDDELEALKTPRDKALTITQFVDQNAVHPLLYDKAYHVVPDGSAKAYLLLQEAMRAENCAAIATTVLGTKDTVLLLSPVEGGIMAQTLHYQSEVKPMPMPVTTGSIEITDNEISMAKILVQSMKSVFDASAYHDATTEKLREVVEAKISGRETVQPQAQQGNIIDLMEALQRSVSQTQPSQPAPVGSVH